MSTKVTPRWHQTSFYSWSFSIFFGEVTSQAFVHNASLVLKPRLPLQGATGRSSWWRECVARSRQAWTPSQSAPTFFIFFQLNKANGGRKPMEKIWPIWIMMSHWHSKRCLEPPTNVFSTTDSVPIFARSPAVSLAWAETIKLQEPTTLYIRRHWPSWEKQHLKSPTCSACKSLCLGLCQCANRFHFVWCTAPPKSFWISARMSLRWPSCVTRRSSSSSSRVKASKQQPSISFSKNSGTYLLYSPPRLCNHLATSYRVHDRGDFAASIAWGEGCCSTQKHLEPQVLWLFLWHCEAARPNTTNGHLSSIAGKAKKRYEPWMA